ncbi:roquin-1 isoform X2 [Microplitis mediator]|uniref:roquin-1 isoform X2 n=1 Tax=Microplitis mediator TaxID=375433 RepID=UPI0025534AE9|nr:roquin-1 isoform X2 [Microplitis mediator]
MPIQAPQWTEFLTCPVCCHDFDSTARGPISLGCGHTICRTCLANLHRKQCPFDQNNINTEIEILPLNEALLQLVGITTPNDNYVHHTLVQPENHGDYLIAKKCIEELALYLKPCQAIPANGIGMGLVSRPMQRKLVTLVGCQLVEPEGRARAVRAARSLGERSVTELILQHQNSQQLSANLWAAVRARGCQFLGPAMQEEVLKLVLLALEDGSAMSRKVLVMFVVQRLEPHFPQASKTSIGHVVQLLYRASCFKVSKREGDSSLMQLKEEFRTYEALRREHDAQIVQIATEAGLRIAPDQWSALLYGDTGHKSHMQSIIDKLQTPQSFAQSVQELMIALQRTPDPGQLSSLRPQLELLAGIDPNPEIEYPNWATTRAALEAVKTVVTALVEYIQKHGNRKSQENIHSTGPGQLKYKISMCRDLTLRGSCPRATNCTFAHSDLELDKYRSKHRKLSMRSSIPSSGSPDHKITIEKPAVISPIQIQQKSFTPHTDSNYQSKINDSHCENFYNVGSVNSVNCLQHPLINNENYMNNMGNYVLPNSQCQQVTDKNIDLQCPHYIVQPPIDYSNVNAHMWDTLQVPTSGLNGHQNNNNNNNNNNKKQKSVAKTLALLLQRRMEIINQLENIIGKPTNQQQLKINYDPQDTLPPTYSTWTNAAPLSQMTPQQINYGNNFHRSDSILFDDEFIPFDASAANKYGPISRISKSILRPANGTQHNPMYGENVNPAIQNIRPISTANSVGPWYYTQPYGTVGTNTGLQTIQNSNLGETYVTLEPCNKLSEPSPHVQLTRQENVSKDLILESQKVKQQLKHLEKKINDLKLATQGAAFNEGERLTQELHIIEAGIREKEKDVRNWDSYCNVTGVQPVDYVSDQTITQSINNPVKDEDSYEAEIANDIRELEMRWDYELQEQEKRWSNEEDNVKQL